MADVTYAESGYPIILAAMLDGLNVYIHLTTADFTPSTLLTPASIVAPVMNGYQPLPMARWSPSRLRAGRAVAVADPVLFAYAGGALPLPIRGYYATDGPGGVLLWAWRRPGDGFQFSDASPTLLVSVRVFFPAVAVP